MLISPILILRARAEARAILFDAAIFDDLGDAIDPLFDYADDSGLVELLGAEAIQQIIFDAFGIEMS